MDSNKDRRECFNLPHINKSFDCRMKKSWKKNRKIIDKKFIQFKKEKQIPSLRTESLTNTFEFTFSDKFQSSKSIRSIRDIENNRSRWSSIVNERPKPIDFLMPWLDDIKNMEVGLSNLKHSTTSIHRKQNSLAPKFQSERVIPRLSFKEVENIDANSVKRKLDFRKIQNSSRSKSRRKIKWIIKKNASCNKRLVQWPDSKSHQSAWNLKFSHSNFKLCKKKRKISYESVAEKTPCFSNVNFSCQSTSSNFATCLKPGQCVIYKP
jgi:hypothetical protein